MFQIPSASSTWLFCLCRWMIALYSHSVRRGSGTFLFQIQFDVHAPDVETYFTPSRVCCTPEREHCNMAPNFFNQDLRHTWHGVTSGAGYWGWSTNGEDPLGHLYLIIDIFVCTTFSLLKLLGGRDGHCSPGLESIWHQRTDVMEHWHLLWKILRTLGCPFHVRSTPW